MHRGRDVPARREAADAGALTPEPSGELKVVRAESGQVGEQLGDEGDHPRAPRRRRDEDRESLQHHAHDQTHGVLGHGEDPEVLENRGARFMAWDRVPGEFVLPYECDPSFGLNYDSGRKP